MWADLYESGSVVLKAGSLLKSNDRAGNYRERWAEHVANVQVDRTQWAKHGTKLSAQLFYHRHHKHRNAGYYSGDGLQGNQRA